MSPFVTELMRQLGGGRFIAMTGAKNFVYCDKDQTLVFLLPRNPGKVRSVRIQLMPSDTYTMDFHAQGFKLLKSFTDIYADGLQRTFTEVTKFDTHL